LVEIASKSEIFIFKNEEYIYKEGERNFNFYLILNGMVRVLKRISINGV
jgi:CRP-like cAMP-binding protein